MLDAVSGTLVQEVKLAGGLGVAAGHRGFGISTEGGLFNGRQSPVNWDQHVVRVG